MAYDLRTKRGYNMYDMSSMLQKAIRRGDVNHAAFAAVELMDKYRDYMWKRLLTVSAEDCYGICTKEIIALQQADKFCNARRDENWIFVAKAIVLLCTARKNRDADYCCCNFMCPERDLTPEEIADFDITKATLDNGIPSYVYDCHTYTGKKNGKTKTDMIRDEQAALHPLQLSLFDDGDWGQYYADRKANGEVSLAEQKKYEKFKKDKVHYE